MKPQVYKDPRPAETFTRFHERARQGVGYIYDLVRVILTLPTILLYRARAIGVENVPASGPVIVTPNHFSQMDHFFAAVYLRRKVQFMAKSQLFTNPFIKWVFYNGGVFPVRRGFDDQEAFKTAHVDPRPRGDDADVRRGRPLANRRPRRAQARRRQDRARVRRAGGPGRDPRLRPRPRLEALPLPEGDDPVRRAASPSRSSRARAARSSSRSRTRSSTRPDDVRGPRGEGPPRRAAAPSRGPAGSSPEPPHETGRA